MCVTRATKVSRTPNNCPQTHIVGVGPSNMAPNGRLGHSHETYHQRGQDINP